MCVCARARACMYIFLVNKLIILFFYYPFKIKETKNKKQLLKKYEKEL